MTVAHLALELSTRNEGSHRIDYQDVYRTGADERVGDLERLLARIGLGDQQIVDIDPELAGIARVERMLGVDEGAGPTAALRLRNHVQREGRLTGALRPVDLDDTAARQSADAKRDVETQRAGRNHFDVRRGLARSELHNRTLAESTFDLAERRVQSSLSVHCLDRKS